MTTRLDIFDKTFDKTNRISSGTVTFNDYSESSNRHGLRDIICALEKGIKELQDRSTALKTPNKGTSRNWPLRLENIRDS